MLHLHRSDRADALVHALGDLLATAPEDPFAREVVAVPTRGMERWLTQRLAGRLGTRADDTTDGVCAAVDFPSPGRLLAEVLATASGIDPERDPWVAERLVWPLLDALEEHAAEPWLAPLRAHLAIDPDRRYAVARHIADLFSGYAVQRPGLLEEWHSGSGAGWQPELWRTVRARLAVPSLPERLDGALRRLAADPGCVELPARISLFGLTRLAPGHARLLGGLARERDVHLMLLHPSAALWERIARDGSAAPLRRREDHSRSLVRNRWLAAWGRDARELQLVIAGLASGGGPGEATPGPVDRHHPIGAPAPSTLLGVLQAQLRADRPAPGPPLGEHVTDERIVLDPADRSLRVHACHGRHRQVAVLREVILHRLAADRTLEPRDVIVLCPDVEEFAPLIGAAFGAVDGEEGRLHVRIADRDLRRTNPILSVAARLLELAAARVTASEVLDLLDLEPVRRRLALDDDDLVRIRGWIAEARIHWGLDAEHRDGWQLGGVGDGTWRTGLRRLLLAAALGEEELELFGGVLPAGAVDSGDLDLLGRLAEAIDRVDHALRELRGPWPLASWIDRLETAVDALALAPEADAWQRRELTRMVEDIHIDAAGRGAVPLTLGEVRTLLTERLAQRPTRANFRTGQLTVCTMHPMRSVPHRVVCLLGLDDGCFPRRAPRDGDDLLGADPQVGDRDARSEDRQMFLDTLMAAQEALVVLYSGNDERTNAELPPAIPVGELLDAVRASARGATVEDPLAQVLVRHPLQAFDVRNFNGSLDGRERWSFDDAALDGARSLSAGAREAAPRLREITLGPPPPGTPVTLAELISFVERPARAFLRQRLGASLARYEDEVADQLPVELDGLGRHGVGQRLLEGRLAGIPGERLRAAEAARGTLPPGQLANPVIAEVGPIVTAIARQTERITSVPATTLETNLLLDGDRRLSGTVSGIHDRLLLGVSYSKLNARHRIAAWVRLLALNAAHPEVVWEAVTVGRAPTRGATLAMATIPGLGGSSEERRRVALEELERLVRLRDEGLTRLFVAPALTSAAALWAQAAGEDPAAAAREAWNGRWGEDSGERAEAEHAEAIGGELPLSELLRDAPAIWEPLRRRERMEFA